MGRLKKDHGGWRTSGLWTKYQQPSIADIPYKKKKKDTKKWCRGKVGVEHSWVRHQEKHYDWEQNSYYGSYTTITCVNCGKRMYRRLQRVSHIPMSIFVIQYCSDYSVPVRLTDGTYSVSDEYHAEHVL